MLEIIKTVSDWLDRISLAVAAGTVALILMISIYGALFRYVFNTPLPWPLSVSKILMIYCSLLAIPIALKRGQHMGVEGFLKILPKRIESLLRYCNYTIMGVFVLVIFWYGLVEMINAKDIYMITGAVQISQKWLIAALPISAFIQFIHILTAPHVIRQEMDKTAADEHLDAGL